MILLGTHVWWWALSEPLTKGGEKRAGELIS